MKNSPIFRIEHRPAPRCLFNRYLFDLLFFVRALRAQRRALTAGSKKNATATAVLATPSPQLSREVRVVRWSGRVDAAALASQPIPAPSADLLPGGIVALDTSAVSFIDSTGLGFLLSAYRRAVSSGGGLALVNPSPAVSGLLTAMKLNRLIPIVAEAADAPSALGLTPPARTDALPGELVLPIQGELTASRVPGFSRWIEENWSARTDVARLVLDLSAVRFMDSSGLGLLLRCHRLAAARPGGGLTLRQPSDNVRNVLRLAKVDSVLKIESAPSS